MPFHSSVSQAFGKKHACSLVMRPSYRTHTHTHTQVLEVRHGAVVGVSEVLPALEEAGLQLPAELLSKVRACVWLCV